MRPLLFLAFFFSLSSIIYAQPTIEWQRAYGGTNSEVLYDIQQTIDGGYIMIGKTSSNDGDIIGNASNVNSEIWVVKLDNTGQISWGRCYGGSGMERDGSIEQTDDGGYIFLATTFSNDGDVSGYHGNGDAWVVKLTATGSISWQKTYGGQEIERGNSIHQTKDGGYIMGCSTASADGDAVGSGFHGSDDLWIVKLTANGVISWQKAYGGVSNDAVWNVSVEQTTDGGYIVGTISTSKNGDLKANYGSWDYWILKLSDEGYLEWQRNYGGSKEDECANVHQCTDGGYIMTGTALSWDKDIIGAHSLTTADVWTVKINDTGKIEWQKALGGKGGEGGYWIIQDSIGNYITAATTNSDNSDVSGLHGTKDDIWLVAQYPDGSIRWKMTLGGTGNDYVRKIRPTSDGGYIVGGFTTSSDGDALGNGLHSPDTNDFWVIKLSSTTGIPKPADSKNISIYPTVTSGKVFVDLPQGYEGATIGLFNIQGQSIPVITGGSRLNRTVHLYNTPSGTYILQVSNKGEVYSQKIVYRQ